MPPSARRYGGKTAKQHAAELNSPLTTTIDWLHRGMPPDEPDRSRWVEIHKATAKNRPKGEAGASFAPGSEGERILAAKHAAELKFRLLRNKLLEIELEEAQGRVLRLEEVSAANARIHAVVANRLFGLGRALADRLLNKEDPAEVEAIVDSAVRDCLAHIATDDDSDHQV